VNRPADIELVNETPLFLDAIFAELTSERAAAEAEVLDSEMLPEEKKRILKTTMGSRCNRSPLTNKSTAT
jgi:hypothetical protein